jgi:hypothetical protein
MGKLTNMDAAERYFIAAFRALEQLHYPPDLTALIYWVKANFHSPNNLEKSLEALDM